MARITGVLIVLAASLALVMASGAQASFPGANGKIAYVSGGDIWASQLPTGLPR